MITLLYAGHDPNEMTYEMQRVIRSSDIVVLENGGEYSEAKTIEKDLNDISKGLVNPSDVKVHSMYRGIVSKLVETIYNSGAKVFFERNVLPVEESDGLAEDKHFKLFHEGKIKEAVREFDSAVRGWAVRDLRRDKDLAEFLISIQKSNNEKNISSYRGSLHTMLYHYLKTSDLPVRRVFSHMPYVFRLQGEVHRRHIFGKEVTDSLLVRTLAELDIQTYFIFNGYPISHAFANSGKIMEKVSEQDAISLSKYISQNWWPDSKPDLTPNNMFTSFSPISLSALSLQSGSKPYQNTSGVRLAGVIGEWLEDRGLLK
jgi:hypothetical protein